MELALFWIFSALMLLFGVAVVFLRSPVSSALSLAVSFLGLAALFILLNAYFIAVIQVLVYLGAVMVLFLFIIMLFDLRAERSRRLNLPALCGGVLVVGGFIALLVRVVTSDADFTRAKPALVNVSFSALDDVKLVGTILFQYHNLPFQIIGVLLLVATVGVVLLSKKELK